ncbi:unnamed protein product, partial [Adineta steineri]
MHTQHVFDGRAVCSRKSDDDDNDDDDHHHERKWIVVT